MKNTIVSIILPFYKQSDHAEAAILDCKREMQRLDVGFQIVAVYNGIESLPVRRETKFVDSSRVDVFMRDTGWGYAVKAGISEAAGEYICYTNSARTDMKELAKLVQYALLSKDYIVKATRILRDTFTRKWVSKIYNLSNRLILATPIWDVNATPKIFPKHLLETIGPIASDGDSIDAEILYKAHQKGLPVIEIPSNHLKRRGGSSTTKLVSSGIKMFYHLVKIRCR